MKWLQSSDSYSDVDSTNLTAQKNELILKNKKALIAEVLEKGLPSRKEESWRNTSLKFLSDYDFFQRPSFVDLKQIDNLLEKEKSKDPLFCNIYFVNGLLTPDLCSKEDLEFFKLNIKLEQTVNLKTNTENSDSIRTLNMIFNEESFELTVCAGAHIERAIRLVFITCSNDNTAVISAPKISINAQSRSSSVFMVSFIGAKGSRYFNNSELSITVENNAKLELVQEVNQSEVSYHFDKNKISIGADATLRYLNLNLGGLIVRNELEINLKGLNSNSEILGMAYLSGNEHSDNQTVIRHLASYCQSLQLYKNLLDDESRAVFSGTVFIDKNIEKADSSQLNNNLLLSNKAEANSKPILNIYSDDVKASHGSTVGQLNKEEIFYLESRAISKVKAINLLSKGFLMEVSEKLENNNMKKYVTCKLEKKISEKLSEPLFEQSLKSK